MNIKFSVIVLCALFSANNAVPTEQEIEARIVGMNLTNTDALTSYIVEVFSPYRDHIRKLIRKSMSSSTAEPRADFITCDVCKPAVPAIRTLLNLGFQPDYIIGVVTKACEDLDLAPAPELCKPTIETYKIPLMKPTLYILKNRPDLKMKDFCGILNPGCTAVNPSLTDWPVEIDDNKAPIQNPAPVPDVETTKIIQITDVHLDLDYVDGMNAQCDYPICCREAQGPGEGENAAGHFGHFSCELPKPGLDAIYAHANKTHSDTKYIFLTGDYVHSGVWLYGVEENTRHISAVTTALREAFPNTPIFPVTGNHEPDVVNMYPPSTVWNEFDLEWMYSSVGAQFTDYIPPDQLALFKRGGYYTVKPNSEENLRLIIVNTNLCYVDNLWLSFQSIDPEGQLQWFSDTLLEAEKAGEVVYVIGHILPGSGSCWPVWSEKFDAIINRYEAIIKAQFYGHSHSEYFSLAFEKGTDRPTSTSYVAPSAVTDGMHGGYKVYFADGERGADSTWEIVDHETWILNITESNIANEARVSRLYNAREDYGLTSLRPQDLKDFVYKMAVDNSLLNDFLRNRHKGDGPRYRPCNNKQCRINALCDLVVANSADSSQCEKIREFIDPPASTTTEASTTTTTTEASSTTAEASTTTAEASTTTTEASTTTTEASTTTTEASTTTAEASTTTTEASTTTTEASTTTSEASTTTAEASTTTTEASTTTTEASTTKAEASTTEGSRSSSTTESTGTKHFSYSGLVSASIMVITFVFNCVK